MMFALDSPSVFSAFRRFKYNRSGQPPCLFRGKAKYKEDEYCIYDFNDREGVGDFFSMPPRNE